MNRNSSGDLYKKFSEDLPAVLAYSHSAGDENLRAKIVSRFGWNKFGITKDHLLICNGIAEAFSFATFTCLDRKDELLTLTTIPLMYKELAAISGIQWKIPAVGDLLVPGIYKTGSESAISTRTKALLICRPLSNSMQVEMISKFVQEQQLFLLEDFSALDPGSWVHESFLQDPALQENVIAIGHPFGKAGLIDPYLGLLVTRNEQVLHAALKLAQARVCPSVPDQLLSEIVLDNME